MRLIRVRRTWSSGRRPACPGASVTRRSRSLNDNMPFLFDSVLGELQDFGADDPARCPPDRHGRAATREGRLIAYLGTGPATDGRDPREPDPGPCRPPGIGRGQEAPGRAARPPCSTDVRRAVADWRPMLARARARRSPPIAPRRRRSPPRRSAEAIAFLEWLRDRQLHLSRHARIRFRRRRQRAASCAAADAPGLGILGDPDRPRAQPRRRGASRRRRRSASS